MYSLEIQVRINHVYVSISIYICHEKATIILALFNTYLYYCRRLLISKVLYIYHIIITVCALFQMLFIQENVFLKATLF
jgi:hypothetical protein